MELNKIYNEDCFNTLNRMIEDNINTDIILTSPPYNNSRTEYKDKENPNHSVRYDAYQDDKTDTEYIEWTINLFNKFDNVLNKNGIILYNISYGNESPDLLWLTISDIIRKTSFMVADVISWKKDSAFPQNESPNKLTRVCEFIFVICRKSEYLTYGANKRISSYRPTGQKMYSPIFNFVRASNNDGTCSLNKATYSTELCNKLLRMYAKPNSIIYDPFMGTGTTAIACKQLGHTFIGSELSFNQCDYANDRIKNVNRIKDIVYEETDLF